MTKIRILWTDDEIEVLKPHILFLSNKGYDVHTCSNGVDAIALVNENSYDIIFLDQNMPGLSGIDTLREIKQIKPDTPVVMITKSEEEDIMEAAIGSQIADFLIKPVNPNQILLSLKKNIDASRLVTETTTIDYQLEFGKMRTLFASARSYHDWIEIYKKLVYWDIRLNSTDDSNLSEIFAMQENEANHEFGRFVSKNYLNWLSPNCEDRPLMSQQIMSSTVFPLLEKKEKVIFIVIDNFRYDQWKIIASELSEHLKVVNDNIYFSILPTATQYARNTIFAGIMPADIEKKTPEYWVSDEDERGKNLFERELLSDNLKRHSINCKWDYYKILNNSFGKKVTDKLSELLDNDLTVLVYNFIDMLSHARTESGIIKDLAENESAFRSVAKSWFLHSPLFELIKKLKGKNVKIVITTDHGTIRVNNPLKVVGDRHTSSNIRYKLGKNLEYPSNKVFDIKNPEEAHLPKSNISSKFIFALGYDYFLYQKNYNHFASYYKNTFQHGGISMNEMIIPLITLEAVE